ncbi:hypothetical protein RP20_CCG024213 [Aedes albopictus]|nr:uncharacterized protein LOC115269043 [Aedes albopictus]KXJ80640.1 hypothetical protein RP20_CCG024213 [Aedes albopictus]
MGYTLLGIAFAVLLPAALVLSINIQPEVTFQRIEQTMGYDILLTRLRITKFNRTAATMNGTGDIFVNLDNSYMVNIEFAHSRLGNNQFNISPLKVPEQPFCHFLNGTYREYQSMFINASNYPIVGPDGLCPLPAGHYWNKNVMFDPSNVPVAMPEGFWRITLFVKGKTSTADFILYLKISRESFW